MSVTQPITTADQLFAAGDIGPCELVGGELIMMTPAGPLHGDITNTLAYYITDHVMKNNLGKVYAAETGFLIAREPDTVRAPDIAFVRSDRARGIPKRGYFDGPPDLAVEVLSPNDSLREVREKIQNWLKAGCSEVWVVDPSKKSVTVHSATKPPQTFTTDESLRTDDLLPGFKLKVVDIFP